MPQRRAPEPETPVTNGADLTKAALAVFEEGWDDLSLVAKLARISGMVGAIEKRGYNAFHKYHYVTEADLVSAVRQYLAASDIVIIPDVVDERREGELTIINVRYTIVDSKGDTLSFTIPGYGADRGDKGVYKALTGSMKYALMKLFKIETGDDPESDTRVDERAAVAAPQRPAPVVTQGERGGVKRGGHSTLATDLQIRRISETARLLNVSRSGMVDRLNFAFGTKLELPEDEGAQSNYIVNALKSLTSEQAGQLLGELETQARELAQDMADPSTGYQ